MVLVLLVSPLATRPFETVAYTSSCLASARLLLRELASPKTLTEPAGAPLNTSGPTTLAQAADKDAESDERRTGYVTYGQARVLMTRADFIMPLDHLNIISVDVRPSSQASNRASRSVANPGRHP